MVYKKEIPDASWQESCAFGKLNPSIFASLWKIDFILIYF